MLREIQQGALAGLAGTINMTALGMKPGAARLLPGELEPGRFLPRQIVRQASYRLGIADRVSEVEETLFTGVLHLGYGLLAGATYGLLRTRWRRPPHWLAGAAYGLAIWACSYEGWIPAVGLLPATTAARPKKWIVPIGSHLIFGTTTALVYARLSQRSSKTSRPT